MTEPDPVLVRRISEALAEHLRQYGSDVAHAEHSFSALQPSVPETALLMARSVAASLGGSVETERRAVLGGVESRQVWHSEWTTENAELPGSR